MMFFVVRMTFVRGLTLSLAARDGLVMLLIVDGRIVVYRSCIVRQPRIRVHIRAAIHPGSVPADVVGDDFMPAPTEVPRLAEHGLESPRLV
jgi:hypothetical protein